MFFRTFMIIFGSYDYVIMTMILVFIVMIFCRLIVTSVIISCSHHDNFVVIFSRPIAESAFVHATSCTSLVQAMTDSVHFLRV
jgi:hypothetical protein